MPFSETSSFLVLTRSSLVKNNPFMLAILLNFNASFLGRIKQNFPVLFNSFKTPNNKSSKESKSLCFDKFLLFFLLFNELIK